MMGHKEKLKSGYEYDCFTSWKRATNWKPGERKGIKKKLWKRIRQEIKEELMLFKNANGEIYERMYLSCSYCGEPINYGKICESCKEIFEYDSKGGYNGKKETCYQEKAY